MHMVGQLQSSLWGQRTGLRAVLLEKSVLVLLSLLWQLGGKGRNRITVMTAWWGGEKPYHCYDSLVVRGDRFSWLWQADEEAKSLIIDM